MSGNRWVVLALGGLAAACGSEEGGGNNPPPPAVVWKVEPPATLTAGVTFQATWTIVGVTSVEHTHLHICKATEPDCKGATAGGNRIESAILVGGPGDYTGEIAIAEPDDYSIYVHAQYDGITGGGGGGGSGGGSGLKSAAVVRTVQ
jgi:hypothetical protein